MLLLLLACTSLSLSSPTPELASPEPARTVTGEAAPSGTAPDVTVTERGDALVVWRDGQGRPVARRVDATFSAAAPVFVLADEVVTAGPKVARYPGGAVALWGTADAVRVVRLDGRGERAGQLRSLPTTGPVSSLDVASWMSGALIVAWTAADQLEGVRLDTLVAPAEAPPAARFSTPAGPGVALAEAHDGGAWVAYNTGDDLVLSHLDRTGTLGEALPAGRADPTPSVAAQGAGAIAAGSGFGLPEGLVGAPELRLAAAGEALVALWPNDGLHARVWVDGEPGLPALTLPLPEGATAQAPALAAGRDGLLLVAWEQPQVDGTSIVVRRLTFRATDTPAR